MMMVWTDAAEAGILERIEPIADTSKLHAYIKAHAEYIEIGNRMLQHWEQGAALLLKAA
jgi:DNA-binding transcriptional regulator YiaG